MAERDSWKAENFLHFNQAIEQMCQYVQQSAEESPQPISPIDYPSSSAIAQLQHLFQLNPTERDILLLCAAVEVVPQFSALCEAIPDFENRPYPTFQLANTVLPSFEWSATTDRSPLQYWHLIHLEANRGRGTARLTLDPLILAYLLGESSLDRQLQGYIYPVSVDPAFTLPPVYETAVRDLAQALTQPAPFLQLQGADLHTRRQIAALASQNRALPLHRLDVTSLPPDPDRSFSLQCRWERYVRLTGATLLVDLETASLSNDPLSRKNLTRFIGECRAPLLLGGAEHLSLDRPNPRIVQLPPLTFSDRQQLWETHLGDRATSLNGSIEAISDTFALSPQSIATICQQIPQAPTELSQHLWQNCRLQARDRLKFLAQRVETPLTWEDLILPEKTKETLQQILNTARARFQVYHQWGLTQKRPRGLGICALFSGYSGTGKTTAAEIIAQELNLDCYRVDLSAIVSKYIGETEKNLRQIFDAAEGGGVVLLFDEADALFSKRGEIKEARDRYANQEVSYLLQRIETYPGLTILTTNLKHAIDSAFERRLKFIVDFPKPTYWERKDMWERMYPPQTPTEGLNYDRLPKLNVSGGNLANVALEAAFLAAAEGEAVQMKHLLAAAKADAQRMGRDIHDREIEKWV